MGVVTEVNVHSATTSTASAHARAPSRTWCGSGGGRALFYSGRSNWIFGKTDSGKSLLALKAAVDVVRLGGRAVYIDAEDEPDEFADRVHAIYGGKKARRLLTSGNLAYINWTRVVGSKELSGTDWSSGVRDWLGDSGLRFVVIDSAIATGSGIDADSFIAWRDDVVSAWPTGVGLLIVDHQPYRMADRERGPIGSSSKKAFVRGSMFEINVTEPWDRANRGVAELVLLKDKPGWIGRRETVVAKLLVVPANGRRLSLEVEATEPGTPAASEDQGERLRRKILEAVTGEPGIHTEKLINLCPGREEVARDEIKAMVEKGLIERVQKGRAKAHYPPAPNNVVQLPGVGS